MPTIVQLRRRVRRHGASVAAVALFAAACDDTHFREADVDLAPAAAPAAQTSPARAGRALRFSVAAFESPRGTYGAYSRLFQRVGQRLGVPIEFVQRRTYREIDDLLAEGRLDAALVCTGGYLDLQRRSPGAVETLAVPIIDGRPTFEAVVIVAASSPARSLADLAGKRFAYTDELSFSGHAYPVRLIRDMGRDPDRFFGTTIYTQSHDRSIDAVASGLVDGAAVHGGVLAHLLKDKPALQHQVRVIHRSHAFGAMPVVASTRLGPELRDRLREVLLALHEDPEGAAALEAIDVDRFALPQPGLYDAAERLLEPRR